MIHKALLLNIYELVEQGILQVEPHHGLTDVEEGDIEFDPILGYQVAIIGEEGQIMWACIEQQFIDESTPTQGYDYTGHSIDE